MLEIIRNYEQELVEFENFKFMKNKVPANSKYFDVRNQAIRTSFKDLSKIKKSQSQIDLEHKKSAYLRSIEINQLENHKKLEKLQKSEEKFKKQVNVNEQIKKEQIGNLKAVKALHTQK